MDVSSCPVDFATSRGVLNPSQLYEKIYFKPNYKYDYNLSLLNQYPRIVYSGNV